MTDVHVDDVPKSTPTTMVGLPTDDMNNVSNNQGTSSKRNRSIIGTVVVVALVLIAAIVIAILFGVNNNDANAKNAGVVDAGTSSSSSSANNGSARPTTTNNNNNNNTPLPTFTPTTTTPTMTPTTSQPTNTPSANPSPYPTTKQPTRLPTVHPTTQNPTRSSPIPYTTSKSLLLCDPSIECMTDRWGHGQQYLLHVGQSLCNDVWRFGVIQMESEGTEGEGTVTSSSGEEASLLWQDCAVPTTYYLQTVQTTSSSNSVAFQMSQHGEFQLWEVSRDTGLPVVLLWNLPSVFTTTTTTTTTTSEGEGIQPSPKCQTSVTPALDCPYLHLRARGGNIILNYISPSAGWKAQTMKRAFPNLFPDTYNP